MARVLVIGSGIAGLVAATRIHEEAAHTHEVVLATKGDLGLSNTRYAQGGIAAVMFAQDDVEAHIADTLVAGAGLCDPEAVRVLCAEGPARIRDLVAAGVEFDRDTTGEFARGLEAAHSFPRVLHAGGDATGARIEEALTARARASAVAIHEHTFLTDLLLSDGRVVGARLLDGEAGVLEVRADAVVLATGGAGRLYPYTSNPAVATGDGLAAAARAGAALADLEFYQFHPTTLALPGNFLVSEAVRGEGAVLRDADGERFMLAVHPGAELAPRDVVARAVADRMAATGAPVYLDATAFGADVLARRFPSIDAAVHGAGLDWAREPVPITPAAHYWMGGVVTDLWGRSSLPGLYAVGEVARTGVHGANRLASNSLLEGAVFAHRAVRALVDPDAAGPWPTRPPSGASEPAGEPRPRGGTAPFSRAAVQDVMWDAVGLRRDGAGLARAIRTLDGWAADAPAPHSPAEHEDANLLLLARLTARAALARPASVGAHFRTDSGAAPALTRAGAASVEVAVGAC
ncbi:L-aspartate oxidase [Occultella glacieicola]|uniref:L-aspartate oxidase n=1 Tax=Occultella glacieicola TaxID=2518684 RepID=A0ABY2E543_9MICO|nr:L-aspartate oxidase [Occultella glacieicola]TDE93967.1 L-aspartate oxidase [Occultella glacieicola]